MLRRLSRNTRLCMLLAGLAPLLIRAVLLPVLPMPQPRVQDEFSHLLVADTFAHGRLANPAHPMWVHFESMHIMVRPLYVSAFPIAQGLVMAAAQVVTGIPWVGVWFSVGLMCAAIYWMLLGWIPQRWALLGAALAIARFGILSYWMNSYFGGAVPAIGGALLLGALPRILFFRRHASRPRVSDAVWFGTGLAILANSRPYEGLVFSLPFLGVLLLWMFRGRVPAVRVIVPLGLTLAIAAAGTMYYFARVTGSPLRLPYTVYRESLTTAPHFIWQSPRPDPVYHHRVIKAFYAGWEMYAYQSARANGGQYSVWAKATDYYRFYFGPFLIVPFVTLPWLWKNRRTRFLLLAGAVCAFSLAVEVWNYRHYAAPATGLAILLAIQAMRQLSLWRFGHLAVGLIAAGVFLTPVAPLGLKGDQRARLLDHLRATPGNHLVIVRYQRQHDSGDEWVYNDAEIDAAKVVWAREMDPVSNREIISYFKDRRVWLVEPDFSPPRLSVYDPDSPPDPPFQFVRLGTPEIEVLRSPDLVKQNVLERVARDYPVTPKLSCDQWNYYFTAVTGVEGPDGVGCFAGDRRELVGMDKWFEWLLRQH